ncbi:PCMD domain-containing protein, partial [Duncaniella muris]
AADWTHFDVEFKYRPDKSLDPEKLENGVYALAVVMTSSIEGAKFSGAIGSALFVDELEVVCL